MKKKRKSIGKQRSWFDDNILLILCLFLLVFIPLYPKWPLFDILPGYIVRVRLEDFLVLLVFLVWLVQIFRKKIKILPNPLLLPIGIYLTVGFLSCLSAIFITKTVPSQFIHIGKLFLHFFRRIEYFSLFFIFYSVVANLKQIKKVVIILAAVLLFVSFYGFGQKYLAWPVYSTMNREFSKGWRLVLTEHARVPSTFAGHYDLAAYLAFFLAVFVSLGVFIKRTAMRLFFIFTFVTGFFLLILTASRTSFIAYLASISVVVFLLALREKKKIFWGISRWSILIGFSILVMFAFGDLSERFANFFKVRFLHDYLIGYLIKEKIFGIRGEDLSYLSLTEDLNLVYSRSDQPPNIVYKIDKNKEKRGLPPDVYQDIPDFISSPSTEATDSTLLTVEGEEKEATKVAIVEVPRRYSQAAFVVGLSSAIRFDALWPMAIDGFLRNPLLGSGYSTLNKRRVSDFTEAESTDNDYLRSLGETGLLGFISFFAIIFLVLKQAYLSLGKIKDRFLYALVVGIVAGVIALLINAFYIDVFEASKIAFTFWAIVGILFGVLRLKTEKAHV